MSRGIWRHQLTPSEKRECIDAAHCQVEDSRHRPDHRVSHKSGFQICVEGLCSQKVFSMLLGLPFNATWVKDGPAKRYNFESKVGKIKVHMRQRIDGFLYINRNHMPRIDADIYVLAVGTEDDVTLIGWAHRDEFWGKHGFQAELKGGPVRAIEQWHLRPMGMLRRMLQ